MVTIFYSEGLQSLRDLLEKIMEICCSYYDILDHDVQKLFIFGDVSRNGVFYEEKKKLVSAVKHTQNTVNTNKVLFLLYFVK